MGVIMSIFVVGGGAGDGKTTLVELLARQLAASAKNPLVIDCNPDQNLGSYLGLPDRALAAQPKIGQQFEFLKSSFDASHPHFKTLMPGAPPVSSTRWWSVADPEDPVLQRFGIRRDGMTFMAAGTYKPGEYGSSCYHSHSGPVEYLLTRLDDGKNGEKGRVIVDNVHGGDAFGNTLYAQGDLALVIASPARKSRDILATYLAKAAEVERDLGITVPIAVVGNRLSADPQRQRQETALLREAAGSRLIAAFVEDRALVRDLDSNQGPSLARLNRHNRDALKTIEAAMDGASRDWGRRRDWLNHCLGISASWANGAYGTDVTLQQTKFVPYAQDVCGHDHACDGHNHAHGHAHRPRGGKPFTGLLKKDRS